MPINFYTFILKQSNNMYMIGVSIHFTIAFQTLISLLELFYNISQGFLPAVLF